MISAFAKASSVLNRADYRLRAIAPRSLFGIISGMVNDWGEPGMGKVRYDGFLDDYAFMIAGLLDLYEVSQEPKWFKRAL